jgi:hypothetical protein
VLESGAARQARISREETVTASINIQLVRIGLVISVDWQHGTGMNHIAPASTACPMAQVGHTTMLVIVEKS